jgi:hypothetical protein
LGFVDGPSVYGYAGGSPQRYVDRDGRNLGIAIGGAIGGPAGAIGGAIIVGGYLAYQYYCPQDCDEQWRRAREMCRTELDKEHPDPDFTGGFMDVESCARGVVSEECGGNKVDYSKKKKRKRR